MKTFKSLRESLGRGPSGQKVYDQKMGKHKVLIHKEVSGFVVYIDGDRLDDYDDLNAAKKAATEFIKMNEETQLDELSKGTLGSYVKKATRDVARRSASNARDYARDGVKLGLNKKALKNWKREIGIDKAVDKMAEETQLDESPLIAAAAAAAARKRAAAKKKQMELLKKKQQQQQQTNGAANK